MCPIEGSPLNICPMDCCWRLNITSTYFHGLLPLDIFSICTLLASEYKFHGLLASEHFSHGLLAFEHLSHGRMTSEHLFHGLLASEHLFHGLLASEQ